MSWIKTLTSSVLGVAVFVAMQSSGVNDKIREFFKGRNGGVVL